MQTLVIVQHVIIRIVELYIDRREIYTKCNSSSNRKSIRLAAIAKVSFLQHLTFLSLVQISSAVISCTMGYKYRLESFQQTIDRSTFVEKKPGLDSSSHPFEAIFVPIERKFQNWKSWREFERKKKKNWWRRKKKSHFHNFLFRFAAGVFQKSWLNFSE